MIRSRPASSLSRAGRRYSDHLISAAATGHVAVCRQTLVGGNYSLVDSNAGYAANPDYFVALLWRNVVEGGVNKGITLHGTHDATVEANVVYDLRGASIYVEDGNELRNTIAHNAILCPSLSHKSQIGRLTPAEPPTGRAATRSPARPPRCRRSRPLTD